MKILTPEEQQEHYNVTVRGGVIGGLGGLAAGGLGVFAASKRYAFVRSLTPQFRAYLVASTGTASAIITGEKYGRTYEYNRHPENKYQDEQASLLQQIEAQKPWQTRAKDWAVSNRYPIVFGSWVASMAIAFGLVNRNPYLTGPQKLVQARVYAQGLTLAVLIASFAFETNDATKGKGRWETVKIIDPNDPEHKHIIEKRIHHESYAGEDLWRDIIAADERRMKEREEETKREAKQSEEANKHSHKA